MPTIYRSIAVVLLTALLFPSVSFGCEVVVVRTRVEVSRDIDIYLVHENKPVKDVELSVIAQDSRAAVRQVTTDEQGRAAIHDLPPGDYDVVSSVSDDAIKATGKEGITTLHLTAMVDRNPVTLASLNGIVVDPTGAVIPNAIVVVERLDQSHTPVAVATSNASGRVALKANPDIYIMRVASLGFSTAVVPVRLTKTGWSGFRLTLQLAGCPGGTGSNYTIAAE